MNKKLLVVAIGAALAAPAFAQSSNVTLYGRINTAIEANKIAGQSQSLNGSETSMRSYSSRLGVRGVEDLGGGLKGVFGIETSLASDTGNGGLGGGLRNAYVGADTGSTGKLVLGRLDAAVNAPLYTQVFGVIDAIGYDAGAGGLANGDTARSLGGVDLNVGASAGANAAVASIGSNTISIIQRKSNAVGYDVKVGQVGISARYAMAGTNDNTAVNATSATATGENNSRNLEIAANYKMGALTLGGGYEKASYSKVEEATATGQFAFDSRFQAVAGYDFGVAKVGASLARNRIQTSGAAGSATNPTGADTSGNEYALSATVPMGKSAFVVNYAARDLIGLQGGAAANANFDGKRKQLSVGVRHDLSLRTQAYALMNFTDASDKTNGNEARSIIAGLRHNF